MNTGDEFTERILALEATDKYQEAENGRRYWWARFEKAEAEGDRDASAKYWRHAAEYSRVIFDMRLACR